MILATLMAFLAMAMQLVSRRPKAADEIILPEMAENWEEVTGDLSNQNNCALHIDGIALFTCGI